MSLYTAGLSYIERLIKVPGMKALLLDQETAVIVGLCYSLSSLIQQQVFLTERIDKETAPHNATLTASNELYDLSSAGAGSMHHLRAIVFIRPCASSIAALKRLLASQQFKHVNLYFSAMVRDEGLHAIAESDTSAIIDTVNEYFFDYYCLQAHFYHFNLYQIQSLYNERIHWLNKEKTIYHRHIDGLVSVMLALKKQCAIKFESFSPICRFIANELHRRVSDHRELFSFPNSQSSSMPLLLVIDRRSDPVTPLLTQWTYTAMCHELLTITNNRINLSSVPNIREDLREVVLSTESDHFYKGSALLNFGDLGASIKDLVLDYQRKTSNHSKLDSIEAMQKFVDNYPEFKSLSGTVSKHVAIVSELSRIVEQRRLMAVSECEQELACVDDIHTANAKVEKLMKDTKIQFLDCLRLVMLYQLRYETNPSSMIKRFKFLLREKAGNDTEKRNAIKLVDDIVSYGGTKHRTGDLFGTTKSLFARASQLLTSGVRGVENIYTQHKPHIVDIVSQLLGGTLNTEHYQCVTDTPTSTSTSHKFIVLFVVGGATYEELAAIETLNKNSTNGVKILLGGSCVHNSQSFMNEVRQQYRDNSLMASADADRDDVEEFKSSK